MNFTKSLCPHNKFEKSSLSIYCCKKCSIIQLIPIVLKKKNNDIFCKPNEYCFNYEINILEIIKNQINNDEKNFINYKNDLENLNKEKNKNISNKNDYINDIDSFYSDKDEDEENYENSSCSSEKTNNDNDFLYSINIYYKNRKEIYTYIKKLCNKYNSSKNCFYLCMSLIEQFYKNYNNKNINNYQMDLIMNAIFILAYKFIDVDSDIIIKYKSFKTFFYKEKKYINVDDLKITEVQCLEILKYNLNIITILNLLDFVLSSGIVLEKEITNINIISKIYNDCLNILDFCFGETDIMLEHSISEIVFSIIYLVRKQNNLIYNIEKYFNKIYNIEIKKYLSCIKYIASIYYKNDIINHNIFSLNEERKKILNNNQNKTLLKPIHKKMENEKMINSYDSIEINNNINHNNIRNRNSKKMPSFIPKSKSLDFNDSINMKGMLNDKNKDMINENINENKAILNESSIVPNIQDIERNSYKPIKLNKLNYSKNIVNSRYKNSSNNIISISSYNNKNNEKNNLNKNSIFFSSIDLNKIESKYLHYIGDIKNNNIHKNNINKNFYKIKSCNNLLESNEIKNKISKYNENSINNIKKLLQIKNDNNSQLFNENEVSVKMKLNYCLNNKINNINNEKYLNEEGKKSNFKIINKMHDNVNKGKIKLPLIKK